MLNSKKNPKLITRLSGVFVLVLSVIYIGNGCAPQTETVKLPFEIKKAFSDSGDTNLPDRWWKVFGDEQLDSLITAGLENNFDLKTVWYRLKEARAIYKRESASFLPGIAAFAQGEASRDNNGNTGKSVTLGLQSEYEIDLWGRIGSAVDAAGFSEDAAAMDYSAAAVTLSAEISRNWFMLLEAWNQLGLAEEQLETNRKMLRLLKARFGTGQVRGVDILRQKELVKATEAEKVSLLESIAVLENSLAVLTGSQPQEGPEYTPHNLPELPPVPETGVPAELISRRPDIRSSFMMLRAADSDFAAAVSSRYPRLSITGSISTTGNDTKELFDNWIASIAGNLLAPLFYWGELSADMDRAEAVKYRRLYEYSQAVLIAFREVEDAIAREKAQLARIVILNEQVKLAEQSYRQLRLEYFNGMSEYLDVLTSLTDFQELKMRLIEERMALIDNRISLYRALAGGFETETDNI